MRRHFFKLMLLFLCNLFYFIVVSHSPFPSLSIPLLLISATSVHRPCVLTVVRTEPILCNCNDHEQFQLNQDAGLPMTRRKAT
jgi:hypothetical protein